MSFLTTILKQLPLFGLTVLACFGAWIAAFFRSGNHRILFIAFMVAGLAICLHMVLTMAVILLSYFGNRLHQPPPRKKVTYSWKLSLMQTRLMSCMIFLFLNAGGLLLIETISVRTFTIVIAAFLAGTAAFFINFAGKDADGKIASGRIELSATKIDAVLPEEVLDILVSFIRGENKGLFHVVTADSLALVRIREDAEFAQIMERAELVVPDGAGVVWAADFMGSPLPGRVPGVALVSQICERAGREKLRLFFLGGKPGIAEKAAETIKKDHNIEICGIEHGYFSAESPEEKQIVEKITAARPDLIFVALGVPRQEFFIRNLRQVCNWNMAAVGVGGSFDVISQTLPRAPVWMQRFGIEWLFRLWLEPTRIGRMLKIPVFVFQIICEKIKRADNYPPSVTSVKK